MCSYLDVLQVYFDQADLVGFRQQLDACDAGELCEGGQNAQFVVDHLTHPVARPHQQGHHWLPVLKLECGEEQGKGGWTERRRTIVDEIGLKKHISTKNNKKIGLSVLRR